MLIITCVTFKTCYRTKKLLRTIQWDNNSFGIVGGISPDFSERPEPTPSLWFQKGPTRHPHWTCVCGRHLERTYLVADVEELEKMDASEIHARRLSAKEVRMPKLREFAFPFEDGKTVKLAGRDNVFRKSTLIQVSLAQGEEHNEVLRESQTGLNHQTKKRMTQKSVMISRIILRTICTVITFKKELHPMYRKRGHSLSHSIFFDVGRRTNATVDVLLESRIDNCWDVDGDRELPGRGPFSPSSHY